ncbi:hypothetical protein [Pseudomonas sp. JG-B]|uniref:hypothetical protein n=1 Tax=Pseudomonas sp. JG-B TaxID=2603214 RepID=UPI00129EB641|nr:hypothetical protein [Pseudomonas sp. JG-B]MRK19127.1 hypothetical protein [Pseudomonas sp. JG-B]
MPLIQYEQDSPEVITAVRARISAMEGVLRKLNAQGETQSLIGRTQEIAGMSGYLSALHEYGLLSSERFTSLNGEKVAAAQAAKNVAAANCRQRDYLSRKYLVLII